MEANMFQVNQRHRRRTLRENLIVSVPLPSFLPFVMLRRRRRLRVRWRDE